MIRAPTRRVETPQEVAQTYSSLFSRLRNFTSKALAKFCPRKWEVPACKAFPSCISPSMQYVSSAPANLSLGDFTPRRTGIASHSSAKRVYTSRIVKASWTASCSVACAVCPSCHRNSVVRRKRRVRISHLTTLAHWFTRTGKSRYDWIQFR